MTPELILNNGVRMPALGRLVVWPIRSQSLHRAYRDHVHSGNRRTGCPLLASVGAVNVTEPWPGPPSVIATADDASVKAADDAAANHSNPLPTRRGD